MKFRFSLATIMGVIVALAFNLALLRLVTNTNDLFYKEVLCNLFVANGLALAACRLWFGAGRVQPRPFLRGFLRCGVLAVFVHLIFFAYAPDRTISLMHPALMVLDNGLLAVTKHAGVDLNRNEFFRYAVIPVTWPLFFAIASLPQLAFAVAGGLLLRHLATIRRTESPVGTEVSP